MSISSRIQSTIEDWQALWKDRLRGWLVAVLSFGLEVFMDILGKAASPKLTPLIDTLIATGKVPPELQPLLDEIKSPTGEAGAFFAQSAGGAAVGGAVSKILDAILMPLSYGINTITRVMRLSQSELVATWLRDELEPDLLSAFLTDYGLSNEHIEYLKKLAEIRLDPGSVTRIWLRDKTKYEKYWADLKQQGWTPDRIEVAKELAKIIPPLADMVRFADFSAFDPEVIARWREFYDAPGFVTEPFSLLGITNEAPRDWANKYWFSHYIQPGRFELGEMFRRSESWKQNPTGENTRKLTELGIEEADVTLAYRTMAYSEFWQKRLLELTKAIPTRVDVRRWWDMRTIDEPRLRELYQAQGYFGEDLEDYVKWTKVYTDFPMMLARFTKGWITEDEVYDWLLAQEIPAERARLFIEEKVKPEQAERVAKERDLTKTDIYKAIKKARISKTEGAELLQDLGFDEFEADLLIAINVLGGYPY
ncbi:hypothetical protein ES703_47747 [subsurface metagenome]